MSVYDIIKIGGCEGQVKCFTHKEKCMKSYSVGDYVGTVWISGEEVTNYSVAMREGGYINVACGEIWGWTKRPKHKHVIDKWGDLFNVQEKNPSARLLWDEKYFFSGIKEGESDADKR